MKLGAVVLCALAVSVSGCRHVDLAGHGWLELQSEHFSLRTDLSEPDARASLAEMEMTRSALLDAFSWGGADQNRIPRFHVVELADTDELKQLVGPNIGGFTTVGSFGAEVVVVAAGNQRSSEILRHELTHAIATALLRSQPAWFAEGIAAFVESVYFENGEAIFGGLVQERSLRINRDERSDAAKVMAARSALSFSRAGWLFEDQAYAIFFSLFNAHPRELALYMQSLARGDGREGLFETTFPGLTRAAVDQLVDSTFDTNRTLTRRDALYMPIKVKGTAVAVTLKPYAGAVDSKPLLASAVHSQLGELFLRHVGTDAVQALGRAKAEFALARAADTGDPAALAFQFADEQTPLPERLAASRRAAGLHPGDWRARVLLFNQLEGEETRIWKEEKRVPAGLVAEARAELEKAAQEAPDQLAVLSLRAIYLAEHGAAAQALPIAQRAISIDPSNALGPLIEAHVMTLLGQTARARELMQSAAEKTPRNSFLNFVAWSFLYQHDLEPPISAKPSGAGDRAPLRVSCAQPEPELKALRSGSPTLEAKVRFTVDANGAVTSVQPLDTPDGLAAAIRRWLPGCRFDPASHDGQPVAGELVQRFTFVGN